MSVDHPGREQWCHEGVGQGAILGTHTPDK